MAIGIRANKSSYLIPAILATIFGVLFAGSGIGLYPMSAFNPAIMVVALMILVFVLIRPVVGVLLLFAFIWLVPIYPVEGGLLTPNRVLGVVLLTSVVVQRIMARSKANEQEHRLIFTPVDYLIWAYLLVAFASRSTNVFQPFFRDTFAKILVSYMQFWLTINFIRDWRAFKWLMWVTLITIGIVAVSAIQEAYTQHGPQRFGGISENAGYPGEVGMIAIPILIWFIIKFKLPRVLYLAVLLYVLGIFFSGSRTSVLGLFSVTLIYLLFFAQRSLGRLGTLAVFVFSIAISISILQALSPATLDRGLYNILPQFEAADDSSEIRPELYRVAVEMFKDHPFLGVGLANYQHLIGMYTSRSNESPPHNVFLGTLAEMGIVGFAVLMALYGYLLRQIWKAYMAAPSADGKRTAAMLLAVFVAYLVMAGMFQFWYLNRDVFLILSIIVVGLRLIEQDNEQTAAAVAEPEPTSAPGPRIAPAGVSNAH